MRYYDNQTVTPFNLEIHSLNRSLTSSTFSNRLGIPSVVNSIFSIPLPRPLDSAPSALVAGELPEMIGEATENKSQSSSSDDECDTVIRRSERGESNPESCSARIDLRGVFVVVVELL